MNIYDMYSRYYYDTSNNHHLFCYNYHLLTDISRNYLVLFYQLMDILNNLDYSQNNNFSYYYMDNHYLNCISFHIH